MYPPSEPMSKGEKISLAILLVLLMAGFSYAFASKVGPDGIYRVEDTCLCPDGHFRDCEKCEGKQGVSDE